MYTLIPSFLLLPLFFSVSAQGVQSTSNEQIDSVHCSVNASASRAFMPDLGWFGPIPEAGETAQSPVEVTVAEDFADGTFSEWIFSGLKSTRPTIRLIKKGDYPTIEREGKLMRRLRESVYLTWEQVPGSDYWMAVVHFGTMKAGITSLETPFQEGVAINGMTADCR